MSETDLQQRVAQVEAQVGALKRELVAMRSLLERSPRRGLAIGWAAASGVVLFAVVALGGAIAKGQAPLANLGTPKATEINAPFRVIDTTGHVLLEVTDQGRRGLTLFNSADSPAVFAGVAKSDAGGVFEVNNPAGVALVSITRDTKESSGLVIVRRSGGTALVQLGANGAEVFNSGEKSVGRLGFSPSGKGTGYLALGNSAGAILVEAGALTEQFGVVRAYPQGGAPPIPVPNFIVGHGWVQQAGGGG